MLPPGQGINNLLRDAPAWDGSAWKAAMVNYIYNEDGDAVGFWEDTLVFALNGRPVAQLNGPSVHRLTGEYAGELYEDMIVDRYFDHVGKISPCMVRRAQPAKNPGNRGATSYGYPDVFATLLD